MTEGPDISDAPEPASPPDNLHDAVVDGLSWHLADGSYLYVSPSFQRLVGQPEAALVGHSPFDLGLYHPDDVALLADIHAAALENRAPWRVTYRLRRPDHDFVWVESTGVVVEAQTGPRFVVSTREAADQTPLAKVEHERATSAQRDAAAAERQAFFTAMGHSTRTPLASAYGYARVLQQAGRALDDEQRHRFTDRLVDALQRLIRIVEEVTNADRIARSDFVLHRRVIRVAPLITDAIQELSVAPDRVQVEASPQTWVIGDPGKLSQALAVLLGNAVKHAPESTSVHVTVTGGPQTTIAVEDRGPGIPDEMKGRIFHPFVRTDPDDPAPGTGLGLYLVGEVAALHGGRAWVEDRPGGGASFRIRIPRSGLPAALDQPPWRTCHGQPEALSDEVIRSALRTARQTLNMQVAYLSAFSGEHQVVIAAEGKGSPIGIEQGRRIPLEQTFCSPMIDGQIEQLVTDARTHPQLQDLPATQDGLVCYIGVPVHLPDGQVFGTLCCASSEPGKHLDAEAVALLTSIAAIFGDHLAESRLRHQAHVSVTERLADVLVRPDGFVIAYQPIVHLQTGQVHGVEALSRFGDDRPVDLWFTEAASVGLLRELEEQACQRALDDLPALPKGAYLSVNLSPDTILDGSLTALLADAPLHRIVIEITEHAAVQDYVRLKDALRPLRQRGLRLAVDDVGNGFASLRHVLLLEPDIVKIDRSLLNAASPTGREVLARSLVTLATTLGAQVIAEGFEDAGALQPLVQAGVTHAQSWLFAAAMPPQSVPAHFDVAALLQQV